MFCSFTTWKWVVFTFLQYELQADFVSLSAMYFSPYWLYFLFQYSSPLSAIITACNYSGILPWNAWSSYRLVSISSCTFITSAWRGLLKTLHEVPHYSSMLNKPRCSMLMELNNQCWCHMMKQACCNDYKVDYFSLINYF